MNIVYYCMKVCCISGVVVCIVQYATEEFKNRKGGNLMKKESRDILTTHVKRSERFQAMENGLLQQNGNSLYIL